MSIVVKFTYKGEGNMKKLLNKKGFTLIELIVVIAIIAILAAILIPALADYIDAANEARDQANARSFYSELMLAGATGATLPTAPDGCSYAGTYPDFVVTCGDSTAPN